MIRYASLWSRVVRHRVKMLDGGVLLILTLLALFYAYEVDVFRTASNEPIDGATFELDEVLAIAALFCGGLVVFAIRRLQEARRETARRLAAERHVRTLAFHDALTGLPNRRQFEETLKIAAEAPPRWGAAHALLMLDLNGFKRINDIFGHQVGDEVLIQVAGRLNHAVRDGDLAARLGGDEFAVVATHLAGAEAATGLAMRIMEALESPIPAGGVEHRVGAAIGISLTPEDGADPIELLRKADIALYRAKADKDTAQSAMRFFESRMDAHLRERDLLERELRQAIENADVRPYYQPLVALDGGRVEAFEALARWTSPSFGSVPPTRFIAVAEDSGLIGRLTETLLEQACTDAVHWPHDVYLAFNISGNTLRDPGFGLTVMTILARTGLHPARLELEITESALVGDLAAAREILGELRKTGVRIALDDFGTGYSSLYHLRAFRPDKIKIDRSFVAGLADDVGNAAIVRALVGLGTGLGATVTAEGVETIEQQALLRQQGCDQMQGYLFSAAVGAAEALELVTPETDKASLRQRAQASRRTTGPGLLKQPWRTG